MNKIRTRLSTVLLAVMMIIIIFPTTAFAGGGENIETAPPKVPEKPWNVNTLVDNFYKDNC